MSKKILGSPLHLFKNDITLQISLSTLTDSWKNNKKAAGIKRLIKATTRRFESVMIYDTIIVGAGSAGCVLAARLSEKPNRRVLLLEAGPDYPDSAKLPPDIKNGYLPAFSHDWGYRSEPGTINRVIELPRAKLVGGCSATNATLALRGQPSDYDEWAALGNTGWSFSEVLPFFRKLENDLDFKNRWHGQDGPIPIRRYPRKQLTPVQRIFLEACSSAGYQRIDDHNAPDAVGAGPAPMNTVNKMRQSTALTYIAPARCNRNLTILSNVQVDRVLFEGTRAVGVRTVRPTKKFSAKHVVLAAGTYASPAILMRSGIGPADHLKALKIAVLADLFGVGQNLMDHPLMWLDFETSKPAPVEEVSMFQTLLTLKSSKSGGALDLQVIPTSISAADSENSSPTADFNVLVALMKPLSRGQLRLRSSNPKAAPIIDLGYFTHPDDMPRMIEVVHAARELAQTPPLSNWVVQELYPGSEISDDADIKAAVLSGVNTYHHPVGTCRMGQSSDKGAVVDPKGSVHRVEDLSVVDASIMPTIPSANTNIPTIMIAEHCAAWLSET